MASKALNAAEIYGMYEKAMCAMPTGDKAKKDDIVICSLHEANFTEPCSLGKVLMVKDVKLAKDHEDGEQGQVFVLAYNLQKAKKNPTLAALKSNVVYI